ncbi:MAG: DUF749 family protein [Methanobacterium sp.]
MFIATLVGIFKFEELPQEYGPFVRYKASLENKNIDANDEIAILNIKGTESNHVLFLDSYNDISQIEEELKHAEAKLNYNTKKILEGHL